MRFPSDILERDLADEGIGGRGWKDGTFGVNCNDVRFRSKPVKILVIMSNDSFERYSTVVFHKFLVRNGYICDTSENAAKLSL